MSLSTCPSHSSPRYYVTLAPDSIFPLLYAHHGNGVGLGVGAKRRAALSGWLQFTYNSYVLPVSSTLNLSFDPETQCTPLCLSAFALSSPLGQTAFPSPWLHALTGHSQGVVASY